MTLAQIVQEANLAPSVHNTQPTRWRADGDGAVLSLDPGRLLAVGDPEGRDARLSMGAALYGTRIAAARLGQGVRGVEHNGDQLRVAFGDTSDPVWDMNILQQRMTWRGGFAGGPKADLTQLSARCDTALTSDPNVIDALAVLNDQTSLGIMRNAAFRAELLQWMRLSHKNKDWARDGLNADALAMSKLDAFGAGIVLRKPWFEICDRLGVGRALVGEAAKTRSSHWIVAFHRAEGEDPLISGEAFYEMWLALTALGQAAWPMAALADDPDARAEVCQLMGVPGGQRLINVLRVGPLPNQQVQKARLSAGVLVIS